MASYKAILISIFFLCSSCASSPKSPVAADPAIGNQEQGYAAEEPSDVTYVNFINEHFIEQFPHLYPYKGHIILGNSGQQLVIPGISPFGFTGKQDQQLILASFVYNNSWKLNFDHTKASFIIANSSQDKLIATGIELKLEKAQKMAVVKMYFNNSENTTNPMMISYIFSAQSQYFSILFSENIFNKIQLRLAVANSIEKISLPQYLMLSHSSLITSVNLLNMQSKTDSEKGISITHYDLQKNKHSGPRGILLTFAQIKTTASAVVNKSLTNCFANPSESLNSPTAVTIVTAVDQCLTNFQPPHTIKINFAQESSESENIMREFYLYNQEGKKLLYVLGQPNSSITIPLPELFDTQLELDHGEPVYLKSESNSNGTSEINISARKLGSLELSVNDLPPSSLIRFVKQGTTTSILNPNQAAVSDDTVLLTDLPLKAKLFTGEYHAEIYNGLFGLICAVDLRINDNEKTVTSCQPNQNSKKLQLLALRSVLLPSDTESDTPNNDLSEFFPHQNQLGFKVLHEFDQKLGLSLRLFPVNDWLITVWHDIKSSTSEPNLFTFSKFAKQYAKDAIVELSCPPEGLPTIEYELYVQKLNPDALQIYGCRSAQLDNDLMDLFGRMNLHRTIPLLLTPATTAKDSAQSFFFPRIVIDQERTQNYAQIIKSGQYTLSSGGFLQVHATRMVEEPNKAKSINMIVSITTLNAVKPKTIVIYGDTKKLKTISLNEEKMNFEQLEIAFIAPEFVRHIRLELQGSIDLKSMENEKNLPVVIATTNFLPLRPVQVKKSEEAL